MHKNPYLLINYSLFTIFLILRSPSLYSEESLAPLCRAGLLSEYLGEYIITENGRSLYNVLLTLTEV